MEGMEILVERRAECIETVMPNQPHLARPNFTCCLLGTLHGLNPGNPV